MTVFQLEPLFVEYSILTFEMLTAVQVILWTLVTFHDSPPFGEVTVTLGGGRIVNVALLTSFVAEFEASLTLTSPSVVSVLGTVHV